MNSSSLIKSDLLEAQKALNDFISDEKKIQSISDAAELMTKSLKNGGKILSCGNGGSMCDAMHFAEELTGRFREDRKPLAAISISDPSHISCVANDYGYEMVFARYIEAIGKKGDVLLAISTSGNSKNILAAIASAKKIGLHVVGLTGKDGGKMASLCDVEIRATDSKYADRAQEIHIKVIHALIHSLEEAMK
jgi:D-sedoheptulose 7-phosphate isomerase